MFNPGIKDQNTDTDVCTSCCCLFIYLYSCTCTQHSVTTKIVFLYMHRKYFLEGIKLVTILWSPLLSVGNLTKIIQDSVRFQWLGLTNYDFFFCERFGFGRVLAFISHEVAEEGHIESQAFHAVENRMFIFFPSSFAFHTLQLVFGSLNDS